MCRGAMKWYLPAYEFHGSSSYAPVYFEIIFKRYKVTSRTFNPLNISNQLIKKVPQVLSLLIKTHWLKKRAIILIN